MSHRRLARRGAALAAVLALAAPAVAQARDLYATDASGNLLRFDSLFPGDILDSTPLTGLPPGVNLRGIDFRPATGLMVGVGSDSRIYAVNAANGAVIAVSPVPFTPALAGAQFGFDFNPVPDRIRIVSDANQNLAANPNTGGNPVGDVNLNPGDPTVVGSAYTNSAQREIAPSTTTLYAIDAGTNQLCTQMPPASGALVNCLPLGVDVQNDLGFDIAGPQNDAYVVTTPVGGTGATLYTLNLATGALAPIGPVGDGRQVITGLAARLNRDNLALNLPPAVSIVRTTLRPRVGQNAAYIARALDPDGLIVNVEWDTNGDGTFGDAAGFSTRVPLQAGVSTIRTRVTDDAGNRTIAQIRVRIDGPGGSTPPPAPAPAPAS